MPRTSPRRTIALLLLAAVLFTPWAAWAGAPGSRLGPAGPAAWGGLDPLRHLWSRLTSVWSETGANIDPGGGCAPAVPAAPGDEGANIDPGGGALRAPALPGDEGANIDPDGRSVPRSHAALPADEGANIDPNGGALRACWARITALIAAHGDTGANIDPNGCTGSRT